MFVRVKKINGKEYAYLVENEWTPWGSRQRVTKYLGKAHKLERINSTEHELPEGMQQAVMTAVKQELLNHGFREINGVFEQNGITVHLENKTVKQGKRGATLAMNEGFLCEHTLGQLLAFKPTDNKEDSAKKLAELSLEAGLNLTPEQFAHIFTQVQDLKIKEDSFSK